MPKLKLRLTLTLTLRLRLRLTLTGAGTGLWWGPLCVVQATARANTSLLKGF